MRTTAEAARYLTVVSPEAPKPCWECFWLTALKSQAEPRAHTPASVSHGLLGLWLCSKTCFPGGEVGNSGMTALTIDEHRWRQTVQRNWVFLPLLFPAGQDFQIWHASCKQLFPQSASRLFSFQLSYWVRWYWVRCVDICWDLRAIYSTYVTLPAFTTCKLKWHQSSSWWFPQSSSPPFIHPDSKTARSYQPFSCTHTSECRSNTQSLITKEI